MALKKSRDLCHVMIENNIDDENEHIVLSKKRHYEIHMELKKRQLPDLPLSIKLRTVDIHRISQYINNSIFDAEECALWSGYVTNEKNKKKGTYVNFYFKNKKKVALHRLIYVNYKDSLTDNEYLKYSCNNKGMCCNINHMIKFGYISNDTDKANDIIEKVDKPVKKITKNRLNEDFKDKIVIY